MKNAFENYFNDIEKRIHEVYDLAKEARKKGLDPKDIVEIPLALNLSQRVLALVGTMYPQIVNDEIEKRIKELEKEYGFLDPAVCLKIAEEIAKEKFCKFRSFEEAMDAGIRVAFGYLTLGVVAAPLEGYTHFTVKKTREGKDYVAAYYSGPIGGAGRSAASISLLIIDYLRELFGYAKYDPTEEEIKRMITEIYDRHTRITNLQYLPSEKEIEFLVRNIPIQIDGDPTEEREVSNFKDLPRIATNRIRSGACLILGEGIAQKAPKTLKALNKLRKDGFTLKDWDWLEKFVNFQRKIAETKKVETSSGTYIQDAVAGRPILGHPSRSGAFRLRYGRGRTSGYSATSINPITMRALEDFIGIGTQLKLEKPTKASSMSSCDSIDGPIILLNDGSVIQPRTEEDFLKIKKNVKKILYLGDILISYGDFYNRNYPLLPPGYCPEWWFVELEEALKSKPNEDIEKIKPKHWSEKITLDNALKISNVLDVSLHPDFIFFWTQINKEEFLSLLKWFVEGKIVEDKLLLPYESINKEKYKSAKEALEVLGAEHNVGLSDILLDKEIWKAIFSNLDSNEINFKDDLKKIIEKLSNFQGNVLEFINIFSKIKIQDKAGSFIGSRMGRPEKAKPRELTGSPNGIFPIGEEGGRMRSLQSAIEVEYVKADFPIFYCETCKKETIYPSCETCGKRATLFYYCRECDKKIPSEQCPLHGKAGFYSNRKIPIKDYFDAALKNIDFNKNDVPTLVKGVRGTSSDRHIPENICKGILRSKFNLHVNKEGTIRYDATELPITHFKPKEISVSVEKLKELGYDEDSDGNPLVNEDQLIEIKPHDVLLPSSDESLDEKADDTFFRVALFIDELLTRFYKMKPFYNLKNKEDLVGQLLLCLAPHNCAGVVGRVIGFSKTQTFLASPYMHAAMRRDCDGDEGAMCLLLDALLNFSREFLPSHRGATQDAPLLLNMKIRANEVDDMLFDIDTVGKYPLELYKSAQQQKMPNSVKIERIANKMKDEFSPFINIRFTHNTDDISSGVRCSAYKTLLTMQEKVFKQMEIARKVRAVDSSDVARLIIERHFIRDIKGNFHKFTQQKFRCVHCNEIYRRPPLSGKCTRIRNDGNPCNGRIIFTIAEGFILKYLEPAIQLANEFNVPNYVKQSLDLLKQNIESVFGKEKEKQEALSKWFVKCEV